MYPARSLRQRELRRPVFAMMSAPVSAPTSAPVSAAPLDPPGLGTVVVTFLATDDEFAAGGPSFLRGRHIGPLPEAGQALINLNGTSLRWVSVDDIVDVTVVRGH
jgi:hypothetical protein